MIITFYSYKGGVGRSMALANIAELFYRAGLTVLMVDWDLEAPGLERFFFDSGNREINERPGVMDLLLDYKNKMETHIIDFAKEEELPFLKLSECLIDIYGKNDNLGKLLLMHAGRHNSSCFTEYATNVINFNWREFFKKYKGEYFIELLRKELESVADIILIDSRTGVTEMSGICTYHLADIVLVLCGPLKQGIDGTVNIVNELKRPSVPKKRKGRSLKVIIIPSRIDDRAESPFLDEYHLEFIERFERLKPENINTSEELWSLKIPHIPRYSFSETLAVKEEGRAHAEPLVKAYRDLASFLSEFTIFLDLFKYRDDPSSSFALILSKILIQQPKEVTRSILKLIIENDRTEINKILLDNLDPSNYNSLENAGLLSIKKDKIILKPLIRNLRNPKILRKTVHLLGGSKKLGNDLELLYRGYIAKFRLDENIHEIFSLPRNPDPIILLKPASRRHLKSKLINLAKKLDINVPEDFLDIPVRGFLSENVIINKAIYIYNNVQIDSQLENTIDEVLRDFNNLPELNEFKYSAVEYAIIQLLFLRNFNQANYYLSLYDKIGGNEAWSLLRHALILEINGKINEAREAILKALEFSKSRNNNKMIGLSIYYLGNNDRLNRKYQLALEEYLESLRYFSSASNEDKYYQGVISASTGVIYQILGNFSKSRESFLTAMALFDEIGEEFRKGCIYGRLGTLYRSEKNFDESLKLFEAATSIFKKYSDHIHEAYILKEMGTTYFIQGNLDCSLSYYSQALKKFERDIEYSFYDILRKGEILYNMAFTYLVKGQIFDSLRFFEKAIVEFRTISEDKYVAFCSIGLGMIYRLDNRNDTSLDYFNEAYNILQDSSSSVLLSWIGFQIGEIYNINHNYKKSIYFYNKSRIRLSGAYNITEDEEYRKALILGKMGSVFRKLNRVKLSLRYYEKSLIIFENLKDIIKTSWILEEMGQVFDSQDQHEKALDLYVKAHELLEGINIGKNEKKKKKAKKSIASPTSQNIIDENYKKVDFKGFRKLEKFPGMLLLQGKFDMAKETYQEILKITALENDIELEGKILRNLGKTYIQLNKFKEAHECLKESLHIFQQLKDRENIGLVFTYIGIAYREEKYFTKGAKNLRTGIKIFNRIQDRFHEIYAKEHLGALFLENWDWVAASEIFEDIIINMKRDSAFSRLSLALCYKKIEGPTQRYKNEIDAASILLKSQGASNYDLACLESIKGENIDKAFEYLEISLQKDPITKSLIQMDPHLVDIRNHERYRNLIYKYIPLNELKIKPW